MKITFLLTWADGMGGTEMAVYTQAAHLAQRHEVEVLSVFKTLEEPFFEAGRGVARRYLVDRTGHIGRPVRASTLDEGTCRFLTSLPSEIIKPDWEPTFDRLSDIELTAALSALDTDVLITTTPALLAAAAELVPWNVITIHQEHRASQLRGVTGEPLLMYAPAVDALVSLTERTSEWFADSLGAAAPVLAAIPNAVPDGFRPRSDLTNKTIVLAARMTPEKQLDHAIEAFGSLADEHPEWTMRIFGDGPQEVRLRRMIDGLNLHDRVQLLGQSPQMESEWAKAGMALLPSRNEAFPLVLLEMMAAGLPVIAYDIVTGPAEIIRHRIDGLLVPAADKEALAEAMSTLMADDALRRSYGAAGRAGVRERFSAQRITSEWEELFTRLAARRATTSRTADRADRMARRVAAGGSRHFNIAAPVSTLAASTDEQKAREVMLQAKDRTGNLVRSAGRLAEVRDDISAARMAEWNLELVAEALTTHHVPYLMVRDGTPTHRLAVEIEHREQVLHALATALHAQPVYAELITPKGVAPGAVLAERLRAVGDVMGLRVFKPVTTESRTLRYGPAYGCQVEFWAENDEGEELPGWRKAPRGSTLVGPCLPDLKPTARLRIGERDYPTTTAFTDRLIGDIDFPIDAVYTWVDDTDPEWRERRDTARKAAGIADEEADSGDVRFRNRDELRYSLRSLAMYAPWIRNIYLVTGDQVPHWLDTSQPGITIVSHREIFTKADWLPTFNSHAIESQLHHISGLSEHFLYFNDDVFLGRPLTPQSFFTSNGHTRLFWSPTAVPPVPLSHEDEGYFAAAKNNRALLQRDFQRTTTQGFLHTPHPLRRSVLTEIEETYPSEIAATASSAFRARTDLSVPSSLHHHYSYLTGRSHPSTLSSSFINAGRYDHHTRLSRLLATRSHSVFCIGESPNAEVPVDEQDRVLRAFLTAYFPVPSRFERS
ncbi:stealth conserved region 3 domain-containing protein [Streptomyces sp. NPDC001435]|uniref:stealth conserved region 3 domain-containing protein n=1 Tax=Streptomyces sp. NPDC001435 TaxID=3364576 RepID=UPI0036CE6512